MIYIAGVIADACHGNLKDISCAINRLNPACGHHYFSCNSFHENVLFIDMFYRYVSRIR